MADTAIKPEIKLDPNDGDIRLADVEEFEEDTDLQFPAPDSKAWFARIPQDLWAAWNEIYENAPEDAQIEVGKMRVYNNEKESADHGDQKIEIILREGLKATQSVAQKYTLKIQTGYNNTIVFSEKDLAGHSNKSFGRNRYITQQQPKPAGINKSERYQKKSGYASAIPKQTALAPPIEHEALVSAQINPEDFFAAGMHVPQSSLTSFTFENKNKTNSQAFSTFTSLARPSNKKKRHDKAVRMEQQQLYDAIYRCFGKYKYWRLGAFRRELRQPEAYIKQSLENVASLVRSGDFAGCWTLKPEYAQLQNIDLSRVKEEDAVVSAAEDASTGDEMDDDFGDLEDVKMDDG